MEELRKEIERKIDEYVFTLAFFNSNADKEKLLNWIASKINEARIDELSNFRKSFNPYQMPKDMTTSRAMKDAAMLSLVDKRIAELKESIKS